ncbi:MAG: 50S ribosomal protein L29 [Rhodothermales bacterium]
MKAKEIRELSLNEIQQRIADEKESLQHLNFQHAIADIQNPMQLKHSRRLVARLQTILTEKKANGEEV